MDLPRKLLWICALAVALLVIGAALVLFGVLSLYMVLLLVLVYGWMLFSYIIYRRGRQDELLNLLIIAVEARLPLAPALRAYLHDRPRGGWREFWVAFLLFFVLPGYYWFWHRQNTYDFLVERLADLLEDGVPLHVALREVPGIVPHGTVLAAAVGESTGQLALCLRRSIQGRLSPVWLQIVPRLLYPVILLLFLTLVLGFWCIYIAPKMKKIFADFGKPLPDVTLAVIGTGDWLATYWYVIALVILSIGTLVILVFFSPRSLWYFPVLGRLYRMNVQSWVLKMLAVMLETGRPVPEALEVISEAGGLADMVRRRLNKVAAAVHQGTPLADSLAEGGMLPGNAVTFIRSAETARSLPWALNELGEQLYERAARLAWRMSMVVFPTSVVGVGLVIGGFVLGLFYPLIKLLEVLST